MRSLPGSVLNFTNLTRFGPMLYRLKRGKAASSIRKHDHFTPVLPIESGPHGAVHLSRHEWPGGFVDRPAAVLKRGKRLVH